MRSGASRLRKIDKQPDDIDQAEIFLLLDSSQLP